MLFIYTVASERSLPCGLPRLFVPSTLDCIFSTPSEPLPLATMPRTSRSVGKLLIALSATHVHAYNWLQASSDDDDEHQLLPPPPSPSPPPPAVASPPQVPSLSLEQRIGWESIVPSSAAAATLSVVAMMLLLGAVLLLTSKQRHVACLPLVHRWRPSSSTATNGPSPSSAVEPPQIAIAIAAQPLDEEIARLQARLTYLRGLQTTRGGYSADGRPAANEHTRAEPASALPVCIPETST